MVEGSAALWFSASGFELLDVADDGVELVVAVQTTATVVGCAQCGVRAIPKDRRWAGCMTVSSKPTMATAPTRASSSTRCRAMRSTADHTVAHDTPKPRAIELGVPSMAAIRLVAHSPARAVSTRRGSARGACSVQVRTEQSASAHDQIRLRHRGRTARRIAQRHPPPVLWDRPDAALRAADHRRRRLHCHHQLHAVVSDVEQLEA